MLVVCGRMNNKREVLEDRRRCESRGRKKMRVKLVRKLGRGGKRKKEVEWKTFPINILLNRVNSNNIPDSMYVELSFHRKNT